MSKIQTARDLIAYRSYTPTGTTTTALTRKTTLNQEWVFGASNGHELMIKFDKNFFKKHLFTYSKKTEQVAQIAFYLWEAAGKPEGKADEFWLAAELTKLNDKLRKTLEHRAEANLCTCGHLNALHTCNGCGHAKSRHYTGGGARCNCKEPPAGSCACLAAAAIAFPCSKPGCACAVFTDTTGTYATHRVAVGKGDNPLAGAGTTRNTCLILDRISMSDFKAVVIGAIEAAETPGYTWPTIPGTDGPMPPVPNNYNNPAVKHIRWDFGASRLGCVVLADLSQDPTTWAQKQGIEVCIVKTGVTPTGHGGNQYQYCVFHLSGDL